MQSKQIEAFDRAVLPFAPRSGVPWQRIEQDYLAVHSRRDARLAAEWDLADSSPESAAEDKARHQRNIEKGAALMHKILDLMVAEPIPGVRDAAVRYLLNRDFSFPEGIGRVSEDEMLQLADEERKELRP